MNWITQELILILLRKYLIENKKKGFIVFWKLESWAAKFE